MQVDILFRTKGPNDVARTSIAMEDKAAKALADAFLAHALEHHQAPSAIVVQGKIGDHQRTLAIRFSDVLAIT